MSLQAVAPATPSKLAEQLDGLEQAEKTYQKAIQQQTRTKQFPEDVLQGMRQQCVETEAAAAAGCPDFDNAEATTRIADLLGRRAGGEVVRFVGRVGSIGPPGVWDTGTGQHQCYRIAIEDSEGNVLHTPPVSSEATWRPLKQALQQGAPVDVLGIVIVFADHRGSHPMFMPTRARFLDSCLAVVGATEKEITQAEVIIKEGIRSPGGLLHYIIQMLRVIVGVVAAGMSREFELAELAAVLQAATTGQLQNANPRAHLLLVGQPGSGKKIISSYVSVLQPLVLPAQASTLTRAGLAAGAVRKKDRLVAQAGLIPSAHLGAVSIEDLHGLRPSQGDQVFSVLAQAMEDGTVDLSNMAMQRFICETALYFDLNRQSQLRADAQLGAGGARAMVADVGLRVDLLTRIDLIFELPAVTEATVDSAKDMLEIEAGNRPQGEQRRRLQVLLALLRDHYPHVDLSPVTAQMQEALEQLVTPLNGCRTSDFDPGTFFRRMANSLKKLVAASARLGNRSVAVPADVDQVVELLSPKVDFIRMLATSVRDINDKPGRQAAILRLFGGRVVGPKQVMDALGTPRRTVMRDLDEVGVREGQGRYRIPAAEDGCANGTNFSGRPELHDEEEWESDGTSQGGTDIVPNVALPLADNRIRSLTREQIAGLVPENIAALTPCEIDAMAPDQIEALTPEQVRALTPEQLAAAGAYPLLECLTRHQLAAMSPGQAEALLAQQGAVDRLGREKRLVPWQVEVLQSKADRASSGSCKGGPCR